MSKYHRMHPDEPISHDLTGGKPVVKPEPIKTVTRYHMKVCIRGVLKNWSSQEIANLLIREDGSKPTTNEAKDFLLDKIAAGEEYLPMGDCDNFDPKTGCKGHKNE